jgi:hypothetical protein
VEFEFVVEMNLVQIGTNEFFPQLIRLAANERHLQSRPYSNQKLGRRDQSAASSELFLSFTRRSFPTGTRDGGRREPCEPQPCSLGERNVCRDLAAVGIPRHGPQLGKSSSTLPISKTFGNCICPSRAVKITTRRTNTSLIRMVPTPPTISNSTAIPTAPFPSSIPAPRKQNITPLAESPTASCRTEFNG